MRTCPTCWRPLPVRGEALDMLKHCPREELSPPGGVAMANVLACCVIGLSERDKRIVELEEEVESLGYAAMGEDL